jgi:tRNA (adenine57-N1/adenine58-N1)-methyltransferase
MNRPFAYGDKVFLLDRKQRRYLITLAEGSEFHTHAGFIPHAEFVGQPEGTVMRSTRGAAYTALRPTLEDFVLEMPRGAQVIYPKDLAPICMIADIGPGVRVFESGLGSGALSMTMLRWGAEIIGYEIREDFLNRAIANVRSFLGEDALSRYHARLGDACEALRPGGILVAYTPSITQAAQTRAAMDNAMWNGTRTLEVLHRGWHIEGQAQRPDHRMVAHTAFLTVGRFLGKAALADAPAAPAAEAVVEASADSGDTAPDES